MNRREFLLGMAVAAATPLSAAEIQMRGEAMSENPEGSARTYHILGVPLRTGSLYPGSENDAQPYRDVQLLARLQAAGCKAVDDGDIAIPSYLPHHSIPPIRSWPGPRIAWEATSERIAPHLQQAGHVPMLVGCDCSIVVGTVQALTRAVGQDVHVLYVDGDFDDAAPDAGRCQSAAAMAVWLMTHSSPFWGGPVLRGSQVTVIGWSNPSRTPEAGVRSMSLKDVRRSGAREAAQQALQAIPTSAPILLHFDIDVLQQRDVAAAYFPHVEGLSLSEAGELLGVFLRDPRIRIIEASEYASLRDLDQSGVRKIVDLLTEGLKK